MTSQSQSQSLSQSQSQSPSVFPSVAAVPALVDVLPSSDPLSLASSTVFITGASGFVGRWLLRSLVSPALSVSSIRCAVRSAEAEKTIRAVYGDALATQQRENPDAKLAALEIVQAELHEEEKLKQGMLNVRHVFHLAASTDDWDPKGLSQKINVEGTKTMLAAAKAAGVRRFVHCGTEAVLVGGGPIVNVDETRTVVPASTTYPYSRTKALAELAVLAANESAAANSASDSSSGAFTTVSIRPRFVWGAGDTNVLSRLVDLVHRNEWVWIDGGRAMTSSCHVRNLCEGMLLGAQTRHAGQAFFVTDGAPHNAKTLLTAQFDAIGVHAKDKSMPFALVYAVAAVSEAWCWMFGGKPPLTRQALALMGADVVVKDDKARKELGYKGKVSVEEGLKELQEHFKKYGTIRDY